MFSSRPLKPWICDFLCQKAPVPARFSKPVTVFSHKGVSSNGCVVKEITDGSVFIKALFTTTAVSNAIQNNDIGEGWGSAILLLRDIRVEFCCETYLEAPEYVFVVNKYVIWDHQNGFKMKKTIEWCMNDIRVQKAAEEAQKEKKYTSAVSVTEMGDNSESQSISMLLQEIAEASLESSTSNSVSPTRFKYRLEEELMSALRNPLSVREFLIPDSTETVLNAITEWNPDYRPASSPISSSELEKQLSSVEEFDFQRTSTLVTESREGPAKRRKEQSLHSIDHRDFNKGITEKRDAICNKKRKVSITATQSQSDGSLWQECLDSVCLSDESSDFGSPNAHSTIKDIDSSAHLKLNTDSGRTKKKKDCLVQGQVANIDAFEGATSVDSAKVFKSICDSENSNTKSSSDILVTQSSVVMISMEPTQSDSILKGKTASDKKSLEYVSVREQAELDRLGALTAVHTDVSGISSSTDFSQSVLYKEGIPDEQNTNNDIDQTDQQNKQNTKKGSEDLFKDSSWPEASSQQNSELYGTEKIVSESCEKCTSKDGSQNDLTHNSGDVLTTSQDSNSRNNAVFPLSDTHLTSSEDDRCKDGSFGKGSDDSPLIATTYVQTIPVLKESSDSAVKILLVRPNLESSSVEKKRDLTDKAAYHHTIAMVRQSQESILRKKVVCLSVKKSQCGSYLQQTNILRSSQGSDDSSCNHTPVDLEKSIMLRYYKESPTDGTNCPARNHVTTATSKHCDFIMENMGQSDESRSSSKQDIDSTYTNQSICGSHAKQDGNSLCSIQDEDRSSCKQDGDISHSKQDGDRSHSKQDGESSHSKHDGERSHSKHDGESSHSKHDGDISRSKQDGDISRSKQDGESSRSKQDGESSRSKQDGESLLSKQDGDISHSKQDGESSRSKKQRDRSYIKKNGGNSFNKQDGGRLHSKQDGDRSYSKQNRDRSHAKQNRKSSCGKLDLGVSHNKQYRDASHAKHDGESSCMKQDRNRSHSELDGGGSHSTQVGSRSHSEHNGGVSHSKQDEDRSCRNRDGERSRAKQDRDRSYSNRDGERSRAKQDGESSCLIQGRDRLGPVQFGSKLNGKDKETQNYPQMIETNSEIDSSERNAYKNTEMEDELAKKKKSDTANKASLRKQRRLDYINVTDHKGINDVIKLCSVVLNRLDERKLRELAESNEQNANTEGENFSSEYQVKFCDENLTSQDESLNLTQKPIEQNRRLLRLALTRKAYYPPKDKPQKLASNTSKRTLEDILKTRKSRAQEQVDTVNQRKNTEDGYIDIENETEESLNSQKPHENSDLLNQNLSNGSFEKNLDHPEKEGVSSSDSQGFNTQPFVYNPYEETLSFGPILSQRRTSSFLGRIIVRGSSELPIKTSEIALDSNKTVQKEHMIGSVTYVSAGNCYGNMKGGGANEKSSGSNKFVSNERIRLKHMNQASSVELNGEPRCDTLTNDLLEENVNNLEKTVNKENNINGNERGNHQTHSTGTSPKHSNKEAQKMHISLSKDMSEYPACQEQDKMKEGIKDTKKQNDTSCNIQTNTGGDKQRYRIKNNQNDTGRISQKCTDKPTPSITSKDKKVDTAVNDLTELSATDEQNDIVERYLQRIKKKENHEDTVKRRDKSYIKDRSKDEGRNTFSNVSKCVVEKFNQSETEGARPCKRKRNDIVYSETESNQDYEKSQKKRIRQESIPVVCDKPEFELVASSAEMDYLLNKLPPKEPVKEIVNLNSSVKRLALGEYFLTAMYPDCTVLDTNYRLKAKKRPFNESRKDKDDCFNLKLKGYKRQVIDNEIYIDSSEDEDDSHEKNKKSEAEDTAGVDDFFSFIHVLNEDQKKKSDMYKKNTEKLTKDKSTNMEKAISFNKLTKPTENTVIENVEGHPRKKSVDEINASGKLKLKLDELTGALRFSREARNESTNKTADTVVPVKGSVSNIVPAKNIQNVQNKSENDKGKAKNEIHTKKTVATRKNTLENCIGKVSQQIMQTVSDNIRNVKENENNITCENDTEQMLTRNRMKQMRNNIVDKETFLQDWLRTSNFTQGSQESNKEEN